MNMNRTINVRVGRLGIGTFLLICSSAFSWVLGDGRYEFFVRIDDEEFEIRIPKRQDLSIDEIEKLISQQISNAILGQAIREKQISVSEDTLSKCLDAYFLEAGMTTDVAGRLTRKMHKIVDALKQVALAKADKDEVYEKFLKGDISLEEWRVWVEQYSAKDKIQDLERLVPNSVTEMKKQSEASLKKDLEIWMLFHLVTKDIVPKEDDLLRAYETKYHGRGPPLADVKQEILEQATNTAREEHLNKWWKQRVAQAKIIIPTEYQKALEYLKTPPMPFLPKSVIRLLEGRC